MNKCKQQVMHGYHMVQCQRNEVTDGFCRQHHPDSVAERDRVRKIAWETKQANSIYARYASLKDRIAELEAQVDDLTSENNRLERAWLAINKRCHGYEIELGIRKPDAALQEQKP